MATLPDPDFATDVARVRDALMRELETITRYEQLAAQADSDDVKAFFLHLASEEKEHVAEATQLMRKLDPELEPHFNKPLDLAHFGNGPVPAPSADHASPPAPLAAISAALEDLRIPRDPSKMAHALPALPHPTAGQFSVGPLKRRAF